jgi:probable phosphoglycerate mutase
VERLLLVRHAHARSNELAVASSTPPGDELSELGREQALALRELIVGEPIELGVASELLRTRETLAVGAPTVPVLTLASLNEMRFGRFDGGPLSAYLEWAWSTEPDVACPGGGESRADAALRFAHGLEELLGRAEATVLVVTHAMTIRYVLDASDGRFPAQRLAGVPHAEPFALRRDQVTAAMETLRVWAEAPLFQDPPTGA